MVTMRHVSRSGNGTVSNGVQAPLSNTMDLTDLKCSSGTWHDENTGDTFTCRCLGLHVPVSGRDVIL